MKRLGKFTGEIYTEEDYKSHKIHECCLLITDEQSKDKVFIKNTYERLHKDCGSCLGCPTSRKN